MDYETKLRTLEAMHALHMALPLDDTEAAAAFRATFGQDITTLLPRFFLDLGRTMIGTDRTLEYMEFIRQLSAYVMGDQDQMPNIQGVDKNYWMQSRKKAQQFLNAWRIDK